MRAAKHSVLNVSDDEPEAIRDGHANEESVEDAQQRPMHEAHRQRRRAEPVVQARARCQPAAYLATKTAVSKYMIQWTFRALPLHPWIKVYEMMPKAMPLAIE